MQENNELQVRWSVPSFVNVCIDELEEQEFVGYLVHKYAKDKQHFAHTLDMVVQIEKLLEDINYPETTAHQRSFKKIESTVAHRQQLKEVWSGEEVGNHRGKLATFYIIVKGRANATWQGELIWVEQEAKREFRSVIELLALIDNAIN